MMLPPVDRCPVCDSPVSVVSVVADGWLVVCEYDHQTILPDSQLEETLV